MSRKSILLAAVLLVPGACTDAHESVGVQHGEGAALFVGGIPAAPGRTHGVEDLIARQDAAWAAKDAEAYAATYSVNAELINPVGGILVGREGIRAGHAFLFNPVNGPFRSSTSTWQLRGLTYLTGSIALVLLDVTLTGYSVLPPGLPAVQPGVVRNRVSWIAIVRAGEWQILHQQMTPLPPLP